MWFIARGRQLAALKNHGLQLQGPDPEIIIPKPQTGQPRSDRWMLSCFCVKLCDVEPAAALVKPIVADHTAVISVLNGIDGPLRLAPRRQQAPSSAAPHGF